MQLVKLTLEIDYISEHSTICVIPYRAHVLSKFVSKELCYCCPDCPSWLAHLYIALAGQHGQSGQQYRNTVYV